MRTNKINKFPSTNVEPLLLTIEEAAQKLRCGRSTIYNLMEAGALPSIKVGHLRRIRPEALSAFVDGRPST
jgi:excisionase family DNA binding protein